MIPVTRNCAVTSTLLTSTPIESTHFSCFWDLENALHRNSEIFHWCMHVETDSRLLFQKWTKSVQDKWLKGHFVLVTEKNKTCFGTLRRNLWGNFPHFFCVSAHHGPSLIFQVSSR